MAARPALDDQEIGAVSIAAIVGALVLIVARHRWPIPTLGVGLVAAFVATATTGQPTALIPAVMVLLYEVAVRHDRRTAVRAGIAGVATMLSMIAILVSTDLLGPELLAGLAWPTLAVAAGDAVRSRREAIAAAEERAARAEATREEAVRVVRECRADVVLMDIRMPGVDGIEATRQITGDDDLAGVKVIVLTTFELDEHVVEALRAGASGFVGKGIEPADLLDAIRVVASGDALLSPRATQAMLAEFARSRPSADEPGRASTLLDVLTSREREVMALAAHGLSNDEIAERLHLSPLTAKTHANRAMMKLHVRDRAQLVVLAYQTGLVRPGGTI
jgi:DNA-binding NarL/FixJ family response regulator